jgi:hypothetical protein
LAKVITSYTDLSKEIKKDVGTSKLRRMSKRERLAYAAQQGWSYDPEARFGTKQQVTMYETTGEQPVREDGKIVGTLSKPKFTYEQRVRQTEVSPRQETLQPETRQNIELAKEAIKQQQFQSTGIKYTDSPYQLRYMPQRPTVERPSGTPTVTRVADPITRQFIPDIVYVQEPEVQPSASELWQPTEFERSVEAQQRRQAESEKRMKRVSEFAGVLTLGGGKELEQRGFIGQTAQITTTGLLGAPFFVGETAGMALEKSVLFGRGIISAPKQTLKETFVTAPKTTAIETYDIRTPTGASTFIFAGVGAAVPASVARARVRQFKVSSFKTFKYKTPKTETVFLTKEQFGLRQPKIGPVETVKVQYKPPGIEVPRTELVRKGQAPRQFKQFDPLTTLKRERQLTFRPVTQKSEAAYFKALGIEEARPTLTTFKPPIAPTQTRLGFRVFEPRELRLLQLRQRTTQKPFVQTRVTEFFPSRQRVDRVRGFLPLRPIKGLLPFQGKRGQLKLTPSFENPFTRFGGRYRVRPFKSDIGTLQRPRTSQRQFFRVEQPGLVRPVIKVFERQRSPFEFRGRDRILEPGLEQEFNDVFTRPPTRFKFRITQKSPFDITQRPKQISKSLFTSRLNFAPTQSFKIITPSRVTRPGRPKKRQQRRRTPPPFDLPEFREQKQKKKKGKRRKRKVPAIYTPSLVAQAFSIYGKRPRGLITGLELRPLTKR